MCESQLGGEINKDVRARGGGKMFQNIFPESFAVQKKRVRERQHAW
jgi:hypothetical protein